jgi:hypothetical protein
MDNPLEKLTGEFPHFTQADIDLLMRAQLREQEVIAALEAEAEKVLRYKESLDRADHDAQPSERASRLLREQYAGGSLRLGPVDARGQAELEVITAATRGGLQTGKADQLAAVREALAVGMTAESAGHFRLRFYPDGRIDLLPDPLGLRLLRLASTLAGHRRSPGITLCEWCHSPIPVLKSGPKRRTRYCSKPCKGHAEYANKAKSSEVTK